MINLQPISMLAAISKQTPAPYVNLALTQVNDHVIRISLMTEEFYWHYHPNSDETFQGLEGGVYIGFWGQTISLKPGAPPAVTKGKPPRTASKDGRSINITFEKADMETVRVN